MHAPTADVKLDFDDVLMVPKTSSVPTDKSSRADASVYREFVTHTGNSWAGVPVIAANMDTVGTPEMVRALAKHQMPTALHKYVGNVEAYELIEDWGDSVFFSIGATESDLERLRSLKRTLLSMNSALEDPPAICLDVANGYTIQFMDAIKTVREICPNSFLMAGNVVTPERTEQILMAGVDCVKIGIGPGSVCTTRLKTGVGYPQWSAVVECADAAHGLGGLVCSDGGCKNPGDVAKAMGAGADFVMIGGMLAGTDESGGEIIYEEIWEGPGFHSRHPKKVRFYGMSSREANEKYHGGLADYKTAEGKEVFVPYVGTADDVVQDILGGLRSAMTYLGTTKLKELTKRARFIRVNSTHNRVFV